MRKTITEWDFTFTLDGHELDDAGEARDELERGRVTDVVNAHLRARFALSHLEDTEAEEVRQLTDR